MQELLLRVGALQFAQIIVKSWNEFFIILLLLATLGGRQDSRRYQVINDRAVLMTKELSVFYIAVLLYNLCDIFNLVFGTVNTRKAYCIVSVSSFLYYILCAAMTQFLLRIVRKYIAEKHGLKGLRKTVIAVQLTLCPLYVMLIMNQFSGFFYSIKDNHYEREPGFLIWQFTNIAAHIFIICVTVLEWKRIYNFLARALATVICFNITAMIASLYTKNNLNSTMATFAALILFSLHENNKTSTFVRSIHELEQTRTALAETKFSLEHSKNLLLTAQIQPHFINNSLMTLCAKSRSYPEVYEGLKYFSVYLRSRFDVLGEDNTITFEQEMNNVEAYLTLERMNYKERLQVEYDIECDDFMIPPLSVQPLVENAVRHGISQEKGGTITIAARRRDGNIIIEVTDDGSGDQPDTEQHKKRKGVGLENIRNRLELVCGGRLELIKADEGAIARIIISEKDRAGENNDNTVG